MLRLGNTGHVSDDGTNKSSEMLSAFILTGSEAEMGFAAYRTTIGCSHSNIWL